MLGKNNLSLIVIFLAVLFTFNPVPAGAHCDTLNGPVVQTARAALEKGDITPVLKWVRKEDESEVKEAFAKALAVRTKGKEAEELADMYFFETLVRLHRAGEGAPYTGLKSEPVEPIVAEADKALATGSADNVVKFVTAAVEKGIRENFARAEETKKHADENIQAGREFVEAYVIFTHYAERLYLDATTKPAHAKPEETKQYEHRHHY